MRSSIILVVVLALAGCTLDRMEHETGKALGVVGISDSYSIERSSRWRVDDPTLLELSATYDPSNEREAALVQAAYAGIASVYPQTVFDPPAQALPTGLDVPLRMHVDVVSPGANSFPVALIDGRTGYVIDRATLTLRRGVSGSPDDDAAVSRLFAKYADGLRRRQ
jgi:hypothetical protein